MMFTKQVELRVGHLESWAGARIQQVNWRSRPVAGSFRTVEVYHDDPKVLLSFPGLGDQDLRFAAMAADECARDGECDDDDCVPTEWDGSGVGGSSVGSGDHRPETAEYCYDDDQPLAF